MKLIKNFMNLIKIIFINIFITFSLIGMVLLTPPFINMSNQIIKGVNPDDRSKLQLYASYDWADIHFEELNGLLTTYYNYIIWRRDDYKGSTINIKNGLRKTINNPHSNPSASQSWFFGGSTTWGTGVNDTFTYPSLFAQNTNDFVTNFGESGYIARQSLAYLQNYLIQNKLKDMLGIKVIFYDGINDIMLRCRVEVTKLATAREVQIQSNVTHHFQSLGFKRTFGQLENFVRKLNTKFTPTEELYKCDSDKNRAKEIANTLVDTWEIASQLIEGRGGKFFAILQPVSFVENADTNYLNLNLDGPEASQFKAVYPLIKEAAASRNINFIDLTDIYNDCNNCYIDFAHVGPQGHQILVSKLITFLSN